MTSVIGEDNGSARQRLQSSSSSLATQNQLFAANQSNVPPLQMPQIRGQMRQLSQNPWSENSGKKAGFSPSHPEIPPIPPYSQIPANRFDDQQVGLQSFSSIQGSSRTRSLSQSALFSVDALPPLIPTHYRDSSSIYFPEVVSMEETDGAAHSLLPPSPFTKSITSRAVESLPPRKAHRRSNSDIPFGFSTTLQSPRQVIPMSSPGGFDRQLFGRDISEAQPVKLINRESRLEKGEDKDNSGEGMEERKSEGEVVDDLFSAYMNLDNIDAFNSSGTDDILGNDNHEDLDSRASGTKTNDSSDNEATSSVNESGNSVMTPGKREGTKRNAGGDVLTSRHYRSISIDSFIGTINISDQSPKISPSPGMQHAQLSGSDSLKVNENAFSMDFGNGEFTGPELKKIMANEKLVEIACNDPKRVKRILANRQSAARSKERKLRYIAELEQKVQTLQSEATTLSAQLTLLQRDSAGLANQNNELKFRLQSMEQQAHIRDALNEALTSEIQRLKCHSP